MAALATDQISLFFEDGVTDKFALFSVRKVNTADTVDVSGWFKDAKLAVVLFTTTAKKDALANPSANVVTFGTTGLANDAGWLAVWGSNV
jgi:hypothetical protein